MKTKIVAYAFSLIILMQSFESHAWDTTAAKFYPLNVGNTYVYHHFDLSFNCSWFQFLNKYRVTINDLVLKPNGKKYYVFSGWWGGTFGSHWNFQRIDSNSMNVYYYDATTNEEYLLDSLLANSGNTFKSKRFNFQSPNGLCHGVFTDTIFGNISSYKSMTSQVVSIQHGYFLGKGIGFLGYSACEIGSGSSYSLKGCIINGVVYGDTTLTEIQQVNTTIPENFSLSQNFPNPFNPKTVIRYSLIENRFTSLKVFNIIGNEVAILVNQKQNAGSYEVEFNAEGLPSGIYFYKLEAGDFVETKRMILLK